VNPLLREAIIAYLRDHRVVGTVNAAGMLILGNPLTDPMRRDLELIARELSEPLTIKEG
jgi:hypothetical protein